MPIFRTSRPVSAADAAKPHLILVGLPGAGKTTIGRAVAEKLERSFLDFDAELERRELASVAEVFASRGEPHFRALERTLTEELREVGHMVLAPGGGWIANPGCLELLRPPARMIYLKARPATLAARMGGTVSGRPLLSLANPVTELTKLLEAREPLYLQSDHTVNTESMSIPRLVDTIVELATGGVGD
jgi:shikimate kinase